jgi:hypothetical protein
MCMEKDSIFATYLWNEAERKVSTFAQPQIRTFVCISSTDIKT